MSIGTENWKCSAVEFKAASEELIPDRARSYPEAICRKKDETERDFDGVSYVNEVDKMLQEF
jgi:hypothetical protein